MVEEVIIDIISTAAEVPCGSKQALNSSLIGKRPCRRLQFFNCLSSVLVSSLLCFGSEHKIFSFLLTDFGQRFTGSRGSVPPRPKVRAPENITTTRHTHSSFGKSCVFTINLIIQLLGFWLFFGAIILPHITSIPQELPLWC